MDRMMTFEACAGRTITAMVADRSLPEYVTRD